LATGRRRLEWFRRLEAEVGYDTEIWKHRQQGDGGISVEQGKVGASWRRKGMGLVLKSGRKRKLKRKRRGVVSERTSERNIKENGKAKDEVEEKNGQKD
jgi:hypothetical protein